MQYGKYDLFESNDGSQKYRFYSTGPNGSIQFVVKFEKTEQRNVFNLAFGVSDGNDYLDDKIRTQNKDMEKIIATIISAVLHYTNYNPDAIIYFEGSTKPRTRLYRIAISNNWEWLSHDFSVWGLIEDGGTGFVEPFSSSKEYSGFFAKRNKFAP